jgi:hypothetical protein
MNKINMQPKYLGSPTEVKTDLVTLESGLRIYAKQVSGDADATGPWVTL